MLDANTIVIRIRIRATGNPADISMEFHHCECVFQTVLVLIWLGRAMLAARKNTASTSAQFASFTGPPVPADQAAPNAGNTSSMGFPACEFAVRTGRSTLDVRTAGATKSAPYNGGHPTHPL